VGESHDEARTDGILWGHKGYPLSSAPPLAGSAHVIFGYAGQVFPCILTSALISNRDELRWS